MPQLTADALTIDPDGLALLSAVLNAPSAPGAVFGDLPLRRRPRSGRKAKLSTDVKPLVATPIGVAA